MKVIAALLVGIVVGFWLDDPADRVETVTVTEKVDVPGPTVVRSVPQPLPDICYSMIERYDSQIEFVKEYNAAIAPQWENFNDALQAFYTQDTGDLNNAITVQHEVQSAGTGALAELIQNQDDLDTLQARCDKEMEDLQ